ncbi:MAG: carbohydrate porin [Aeromonas sp.]
MRTFQKLSTALAMAAVTTLAPSFAYANSDTAALEKRLQDLEAKLDIALKNNEQQQQQKQQQPEPAMADAVSNVIKPIVFSGYARYGTRFQGGDAVMVGSDGALNGNATGRLGNEGNGGEYQLTRTFKSDAGAIWDLGFMIDDWAGGDIGIKKMYASVTNVFESQPGMTVWAGRDFHQRYQTDLNDYYWMMTDGQGAGFKNMEIGSLKLDMGAVGQAGEENDDGSFNRSGDSGRFALTSKLHGIKLGDADLTLLANYGDTSKKIDKTEKRDKNIANNAYQVASELVWNGHKFVVRYADNAKDSVFDLAEDQQALLFSLDGAFPLTNKLGLQYLTAYQKLYIGDDGSKPHEDRANYNVIVRPTYQWNDVHSTWLELGYNVVDYSEIDATNKSWKATLSQNIAIAGIPGARPMLRFYTTVGNSDNEYNQANYNPESQVFEDINDQDTLTVGAMFEAWW